MTEIMEIRKKVSLIGDPGVGKTSLIRRFVYDEFADHYLTTIGMKVTKKVMDFELGGATAHLSLQIWDTMGQRQFKPLIMKYFHGSEGAFIVCDITDKSSLAHAKDWANLLIEVAGRIPVIFLANKIDLIDEAQFAPSDLETIVRMYGHSFFVTSAKTGQNVDAAFQALGQLLVDQTIAASQNKG